MKLILNWVVSALAILISAYLLPGVHVQSFITALLVSLVLGIVNAILKPILVILTLPITLITFGLFTFVINAILVILTSELIIGFSVDSFWWALLFSLVLSVVNSILHSLIHD